MILQPVKPSCPVAAHCAVHGADFSSNFKFWQNHLPLQIYTTAMTNYDYLSHSINKIALVKSGDLYMAIVGNQSMGA